MTVTTTPAPRAALVLSNEDYHGVAHDPVRARMLDAPDSLVIPYSVQPVAQVARVLAIRERLVESDQLSTGQLLLRSPYETGKFEFADEAIESFVKAKYYHLASIAAHLGASSIKFVKVEIEHGNSLAEAGLAAPLKFLNADGKFAKSIKNDLESRFEASTQLQGKSIDVENARAFMADRRMSSDPDVSGLIDLCATGNPPRKHRVKINGLREASRSLTAGLALTAELRMKLGGSGMFKQAAESLNSIEVTTEITWPER